MLRLQQIVRPLGKQMRAFTTSSTLSSSSAGSNDGNQKGNKDDKHPLTRSMNILKNDMKKVTNFFKPAATSNVENTTGTSEETDDLSEKLKRFQGTKGGAADEEFQTYCDVVVIGGGGVGSSVAYWLKEKARNGLNVVVVERDPTVNFYSNFILSVYLHFKCLFVFAILV